MRRMFPLLLVASFIAGAPVQAVPATASLARGGAVLAGSSFEWEMSCDTPGGASAISFVLLEDPDISTPVTKVAVARTNTSGGTQVRIQPTGTTVPLTTRVERAPKGITGFAVGGNEAPLPIAVRGHWLVLLMAVYGSTHATCEGSVDGRAVVFGDIDGTAERIGPDEFNGGAYAQNDDTQGSALSYVRSPARHVVVYLSGGVASIGWVAGAAPSPNDADVCFQSCSFFVPAAGTFVASVLGADLSVGDLPELWLFDLKTVPPPQES